ncbi:MAG: hypothetical protein EBR30_30835 [Cytophagia bacterium]|nr:hypothetical protein [Cytophagia bacterium]
MDLMQTELGKILNRARTLHTTSLWLEVFKDGVLKRQVLQWIQQDQLFEQGIDEDGDIIGTYSEFTELINPEKVAGSHYTLFDTGEFYRSMYVVVLSDSIVIEADPVKIDDNGEKTNLFYEYGEGIVGLTDENKQKLAEEVANRFQNAITRLFS